MGNLTLRLHEDWRLETDSTSVSHGHAKKVRVTGIPAGSESTGIYHLSAVRARVGQKGRVGYEFIWSYARRPILKVFSR